MTNRHMVNCRLAFDTVALYSFYMQDVAYLSETSVWFATDVRSCRTTSDAEIRRLLSSVEQ